jgi:hypothetical protein
MGGGNVPVFWSPGDDLGIVTSRSSEMPRDGADKAVGTCDEAVATGLWSEWGTCALNATPVSAFNTPFVLSSIWLLRESGDSEGSA